MTEATTTRGRPRDPAIDRGVLEAALAELAARGYAAFSLAAVAEAAGTTRPAIYRRWPTKEALVVEAIAHLAAVDPPPTVGDPFTDLVAELEHFRHCISEAAALPLAGLMLGDGADPEIRARYHDLVVVPRRARLRGLLSAAQAGGAIDADADLLVAGSLLTGSWYSLALVQAEPPADWAERVARLVWRACGGTPPR
ncbi:TetR/AcrR family transcriptional regulator [Nocardioides sp.]|uniref:TetR/AcrR family transcriptional regulator n=1 Tax=Nocardioides sp. TaxID=35761 RepID=UPI00351126F9